jgi:hypothetical protein
LLSYPGDHYEPTGEEYIFFLRDKQNNSMVLHTETYDQVSTCGETRVVDNHAFIDLYVFGKTIEEETAQNISLLLFSQYERDSLDKTGLYNNKYGFNTDTAIIDRTAFSGQWNKVNYNDFKKEQPFVLDINPFGSQIDLSIYGKYYLSSSNRMRITETKNIDISNNEDIQLDILKSETGNKRGLRLKRKYEQGNSSILVKLWLQDANSSSLFIGNTSFSYDKTSIFLAIPDSVILFKGYVEVIDYPRDTVGLKIPITL